MILEKVGRAAPERRPVVFFVSADAEGAREALRRAAELRRAGIACELDARGGKMKAQFKQAERVGARYALVLGGNEVQTGQAKLKDMATREETPVALADARAAGGVIRLLVIAGPTASGKTALAVALARRLGGEIVNADSQQVYRGLDVGTAKPTADGARRRRPTTCSTWSSRGRAWTRRASSRSPTPPSRTSPRAAGCRSSRAAPGSTCARSSTASSPRPAAIPRSAPGSRTRRRASAGPRCTRGSPRSIPEAAARIRPNDLVRIVRALEIAAGGTRPSELHAAHAFQEDRYAARLLALDPPREALHARIDQRVSADVRGRAPRRGARPRGPRRARAPAEAADRLRTRRSPACAASSTSRRRSGACRWRTGATRGGR